MKEVSPSCERNKQVIAEALDGVMPKSGVVLEVASGTGQHIAHFAERFSALTFIPSDRNDELFHSIASWSEGLENVKPAITLDVLGEQELPKCDVVFNANMIHISPPETLGGLMSVAGRALNDDGRLALYGPFKRNGEHTSESNVKFEEWVKSKDPSYSVRDLEEVAKAASENGLRLAEIVAMPANNFLLVFQK